MSLSSLGLPWVAAAGTSHGCEQPWYEVTPGVCAPLCIIRTPARGKMGMVCPYIITQRWAGQIKLKVLLPLLPSHNAWSHMQPGGLTVVTPGKSLACSVWVPRKLARVLVLEIVPQDKGCDRHIHHMIFCCWTWLGGLHPALRAAKYL